MDDKQQILTNIHEEFGRWEELLAGMSETQITAPNLPSNLSVKDVMAHLRAWQQRTIARLEGALHDREPELPRWPATLDPNADEDVDKINAWIYETNREQPWPVVYRAWREGYQRFMELAEAIPEKDLLDPQRFAWMDGYSIAYILQSSYDHHHEEHYGPLTAWLREQGDQQ